MRKHNILRTLFFALCALAAIASNAQTTTIFSYTGAVQTFTVPPGVTSVLVTAQGGSGGNNARVSMVDSPGHGGCVTATLAVTPGTVLNIFVGQQGADATTSAGGAGGLTAGTPSGGAGALGYSPYAGGGGGGASDIRIGGTALSNRVIVAAGGGGAGGNYFFPPANYERGGDGGGTTGEDGTEANVLGGPGAGGGGTPTAGGVGGVFSGWGSATAGLLGLGGVAGAPSGGGGGGGGYYGGGGGSWGGGGGGSNYADPVLTSAVTHTRGCVVSDSGMISITVTCVPPVAGTIVGPTNFCENSTTTYTNPTGTAGGTWSSSDVSVATIGSSSGIAFGVAPGVVTFTYSIVLSCGSAFTSTTVTVDPAPAPITGPTSMCNTVFPTVTLTSATPGGVWSSGTSSVASIGSSSGVITAGSVGTSIVSYTAAGCSSTLLFTVNPLPAPIVAPAQLCHGLTTTATCSTPGGVWSSNVPSQITVGSLTGICTGVGFSGASNIIYTLPTGCSSLTFMSVTTPPQPITGPNQVCESNAIILNELVGGGTWSSSSSTIASYGTTVVPTAEVITGLSAGVVNISYTTPACPPVFHTITVNPLPAIITGSTVICAGVSTTLYDATPGGSWSSGNPSILVTPSGLVTSSTVGISGTIYYTLPTGCFVSTMVNVSLPPAPIIGLDSICTGTNTTLTCTPPTGIGTGIWSSTNLAIAQIIDTSGVLSGISAGTVNISYTLGTGCFSVKTFVVQPLLPGGVTINRTPLGTICEGTPMTFTATPTYGGNPTYIWKKFSVPVGGIDTTGIYTYSPIHGDVIECFMYPHNICALHDSVADTFYVDVYPNNVIPIVTITTAGPYSIPYIGQVVTFFANVTWGGTDPQYQWYKDGTAIPGATESSYAATVYLTETYWCDVTGNPPCEAVTPGPSQSNKITIYNTLGITPSNGAHNMLSLYPNPNNGSFVLAGKIASLTYQPVTYQVVNMVGQVVSSGNTVPNNGAIKAQIQLENMPGGNYLLKVNTVSGVETFHFVIDK